MGFLLQTAPSIAYSPKVPAFITSTISHSAATAFSFSGNVGFSHVCSCSCTGRGAPELGSSSKRGSSLIIARATIGDDEESRFLDEDGSVKDMDGYLNHLSLEYDSVWDTKPAWCQPWTIVLTGVIAISGNWFVFHSTALTAITTIVIGTWWYIFLYSYPQAYTEMIAERRKKVESGLEDTFGVNKVQ